MMHRGQSQKQVMVSSQNNECNCFGYSQQSRQYFLSKHKSLQIKNKQSHQPIVQQDPQSFKNAGKRSLKKNFSPSRQAPLTSRTNDKFQQYYTSSFKQIPRMDIQTKQVHSQQKRYQINTDRSDKNEKDRYSYPVLLENNSNKTGSWQPSTPKYFYTPQNTPFSPTKFIITHNNPSPPIRINFSHSPTHKYSPQNSPRQIKQPERNIQIKKVIPNPLSQFKEQVKINIKQTIKEVPHQQVVEFQLTEDNMDSPRHMPVQKKKHTQYLHIEQHTKSMKRIDSPSEYFNYGETFKSKIQKPKNSNKKQTFKSRIQVNKSNIDPKKSGIGDIGKSKVRSLREQKTSLKKMDDVEQIRSMVDSDQIEEDKQSVVLGRLHQYGSQLDPTLSLTTPTLRSKLVSMNTQSSTIAKSFLRPFQFNMDRTHFK